MLCTCALTKLSISLQSCSKIVLSSSASPNLTFLQERMERFVCVVGSRWPSSTLWVHKHTDRMAKEISLFPSNMAFSFRKAIVECVVLSVLFIYLFLASTLQCLLPHNASVCVNISPSLSLALQILTVPTHWLKNNAAVVGWEWCVKRKVNAPRGNLS